MAFPSWTLRHGLDKLGFGIEEMEAFVEREKPEITNHYGEFVVSYTPIDGGPEAIPRVERDAWLRELDCQLLLANTERVTLEEMLALHKQKINALEEWKSTIQEMEKADVTADDDEAHMAEMVAKEAERMKNIDKSTLNRWVETTFLRDYSSAKPVDPAEVPEYERKNLCKGEVYATPEWAAFIDIGEIPESYNANAVNTHEVHYGLIPHPDNYTHWNRTGWAKQPQWTKTAKRFKSIEEAQAFYDKTKMRLDKQIRAKEVSA